MHTKHPKRKVAAKSVVKPKVIKKEPKGYNKESLCHLVGDRVKLIQQIFQTLKSKTIKSIAPEFLQECTAESLQEYCLDEILGISNKRLIAIIQATKCPTDTEDSDSDVEKIEEHISLEEITSDSEAEQPKKPTRGSKGGIQPMSVLELLELQARARAIRSQLSLEPVTKIELDSDSEYGEASTKALPTATKSKNVAVSQPPPPKPVAQTAPAPTNLSNSPAEFRPVRLKRNFQQRIRAICEPTSGDEAEAEPSPKRIETVDDQPRVDAVEKETSLEPVPTTNVDKVQEKTAEEPVEQLSSVTEPTNETANSDVVEPIPLENSRSPSPDIVPIITSPPIFCISSESENEDEHFLKKVRTTNMTTTVTFVNRPETADAIFLRKVKESASGSKGSLAVTIDRELLVRPAAPVASPPVQGIQPIVSSATEVQEKNAEESEAEEGELSDDDYDENKEEEEPMDVQASILIDDKCSNNDDLKEKPTLTEIVPSTEVSVDISTDDEEDDADNEPFAVSSSAAPTIKTEVLELTYRTDDIVDIDDDEDIIDLGKDETLDFDVDSAADQPPDDENADAASWGHRWLRCKKVSKVLATSRLANKVRTKIKQTKVKEAADSAASIAAAAATAKAEAEELKRKAVEALIPDTSVEEGSVEQYTSIRLTDTEPDKST